MTYVTVFFDFEGCDHNPTRGGLDTESLIANILNILKKKGVNAVFNTCGVVVENNPDIVKTIYEEGHEIASHGYAHENFGLLEKDELNSVLEKTECIVKETVGVDVKGLRSPWLAESNTVVEVLRERGYEWMSNTYMVLPETWLMPDAFHISGSMARKSINPLKLFYKKMRFKRQWSKYPKTPCRGEADLFDIPMLSSMDGDLVFYVPPSQRTPQKWLDYALESWEKQFTRCTDYFNLNFHPWVIGSANRLGLLDKILDYISNKEGVEFITASESVEVFSRS